MTLEPSLAGFSPQNPILEVVRLDVELRAKAASHQGLREAMRAISSLAGEIQLVVGTLNRVDVSKEQMVRWLPQLKAINVGCQEFLRQLELRWWLVLVRRFSPSTIEEYLAAVDRLDGLVETWEMSIEGSVYEILEKRIAEVKA